MLRRQVSNIVSGVTTLVIEVTPCDVFVKLERPGGEVVREFRLRYVEDLQRLLRENPYMEVVVKWGEYSVKTVAKNVRVSRLGELLTVVSIRRMNCTTTVVSSGTNVFSYTIC